MFKRLVQKRNTILIAFTCIFLALLLFTLIFSNAEDKYFLIIISFIIPAVFYGGVRLMFKASRIYGPLKFIKFAVRFFFFVMAFVMVYDLVAFILRFPNGLSPALFIGMAIIIAVLDEEKKNIEIQAQMQSEE